MKNEKLTLLIDTAATLALMLPNVPETGVVVKGLESLSNCRPEDLLCDCTKQICTDLLNVQHSTAEEVKTISGINSILVDIEDFVADLEAPSGSKDDDSRRDDDNLGADGDNEPVVDVDSDTNIKATGDITVTGTLVTETSTEVTDESDTSVTGTLVTETSTEVTGDSANTDIIEGATDEVTGDPANTDIIEGTANIEGQPVIIADETSVDAAGLGTEDIEPE